MVAVQGFPLLYVLTALTSASTAFESNNSTQHPFPGGFNNGTGIVPCEEMDCTNGTCCQQGRRICPHVPPCFVTPTRCIPNASNSTGSNGTIICNPIGGNWYGSLPCEKMACPDGTCCEPERLICLRVPPCFTFPTKCIDKGDNDMAPNSTVVNGTVICSAASGSSSGSGGGEEEP
ncbi:hypothetical protein OESDEN_12680 [Oesophagostomum dentatum]|uniref:Uncharacterized protein n=1 Tax=Oesophagostomum dentatum TaxID=61180 RepID=A0A0B1SWI0_OESDE|nr:hypothetical protein OESDEN_12680 [Oesophagostomum dentatum]